MSADGIAARRSAAYLLDRITGDGKLMSDLIAGGALERLSPPDRARAQRLATDVLRNMDRVDRLMTDHVQKTPPLPIHNLLRIGALELAQGAAAHGVVNDLVSIASRSKRHGRLKGLVNAVLRKLADHAAQDWLTLPTPRIPDWLRAPLLAAWGRDTVRAMEEAHAAGAPLDLSARGDAAELAKQLGGTLLPTGTVRLTDPGQVSGLPGYTEGAWWVQDAAAAIPARLVDGHKVLDLCAAPGGKTMQLAAAGKDVTAVDLSDKRLERVRENLSRTGLTAELLQSDALEVSGQWDAVLLDAPCSATGTLRRHPDLPFAKDGSEFFGLIDLQARMIDHAVTLLRPGGQLVFCTCSLLPDEGEVQIEEALERHPDLQIDTAALEQPWIESEWRSTEGGLRLRPDFWAEQGGMDGFYIAPLRKHA
ncbi:methyltransferase domain-containing protein [Aliishimia ponticola]|uniref:Methyltransferase domain-containing protein n=1 Tax=Aliishimia ponticola TaxID=2499833 RepID=A0A4S4NDY0_9RHOB|nr:RsmB/NOP family class I SAM-dependent RNA methyltransferase [Aliishimia ponticola]THH36747.1 methyltransferase domain-containing protein [Aliishimia ponticola]